MISDRIPWYNVRMKIKKPKTIKAAGAGGGTGGAAIADRFRLDAVENKKNKGGTVGKTATAWAFSAGLLALLLVVGLAGMLYKHWEYLMPV